MTTQNTEIDKGDWQNITTGLTLENGQTYKISVLANGESEICIADTKPVASFKGHPLSAKTIFEYTYATSDIIWIRLSSIASDTAIVVIT